MFVARGKFALLDNYKIVILEIQNTTAAALKEGKDGIAVLKKFHCLILRQ